MVVSTVGGIDEPSATDGHDGLAAPPPPWFSEFLLGRRLTLGRVREAWDIDSVGSRARRAIISGMPNVRPVRLALVRRGC